MITVGGREIKLNHFPDNSLLLSGEDIVTNSITWCFESNEEIFAIYCITRYLKERKKCKKIVLYMPYLPNARQDRVEKPTDIFTLKYFAEIINSLKFYEVVVLDAHSNVGLALLNNVKEISPKDYIQSAIRMSGIDLEKDLIFYPDQGAEKRYSKMIEAKHTAFGYKKRSIDNGEIISLEVFGDMPKEPFNVMIIDDICSYGGTFLHSAKKLKELGANKIFLYVTHCENSVIKGDMIKSGLIDHIYTTGDILNKYVAESKDIISIVD